MSSSTYNTKISSIDSSISSLNNAIGKREILKKYQYTGTTNSNGGIAIKMPSDAKVVVSVCGSGFGFVNRYTAFIGNDGYSVFAYFANDSGSAYSGTISVNIWYI